jgi:hypothetical protein
MSHEVWKGRACSGIPKNIGGSIKRERVSQLAVEVHDRPTVFVLVGDHAPPFGDPQLRNQFSTTQVPYLMLTPRQPGRR